MNYLTRSGDHKQNQVDVHSSSQSLWLITLKYTVGIIKVGNGEYYVK